MINTNWHPIKWPFRSYRRLWFIFWTKNGHLAFLSPNGGLEQRTLFILGSLETYVQPQSRSWGTTLPLSLSPPFSFFPFLSLFDLPFPFLSLPSLNTARGSRERRAVSFPSGVRGGLGSGAEPRGPQTHSPYLLSPEDVSGGNNFGCFCADKKSIWSIKSALFECS